MRTIAHYLSVSSSFILAFALIYMVLDLLLGSLAAFNTEISQIVAIPMKVPIFIAMSLSFIDQHLEFHTPYERRD